MEKKVFGQDDGGVPGRDGGGQDFPILSLFDFGGLGWVAALVICAAFPVLGLGAAAVLVMEASSAATGLARRHRQREAKQRYLEKLRAQSRERHRIKKRAPTRPCPSAGEVCAQWDRSHDSLREMISFGLLLHDVEPYVDNSLIFKRDASGQPVRKDGKPVIVGRGPGLRGWLAEHCPHIGYKTAMRYKSLAEKSRKAGNPDEIIKASPSVRALQEALYRELGIVHYSLGRPRRRRNPERPLNHPGQGCHREQAFIYGLRCHARDALAQLPHGSSRRFIRALRNLAEEMDAAK